MVKVRNSFMKFQNNLQKWLFSVLVSYNIKNVGSTNFIRDLRSTKDTLGNTESYLAFEFINTQK